MVKVAIVDNERKQAKIIAEYLDELSETYHIEYDIYLSGDELLEHYHRVTPEDFYDIAFLAVDVGDNNGLAVGNEIRKFDTLTSIVLVTNDEKYIKGSFDCNPSDYLVKPVSKDEFFKVFKEALAFYKVTVPVKY